MPELPDVEGFRRVLAEHGVGRRIRRVEVLDPGVLHDLRADELAAALTGHRFRDPDRRGKVLIAYTDGPTLLLHFGMSGDLRWATPTEPRHQHDRVLFALAGGELRYRDMRKLQGIWLAPDAGTVERTVARLGPDALAIRRAEFDQRLTSRRGAVKSLLVDQAVVAGLGNLLADEIDWRAGVNPWETARDLDADRRRRLYDEMRTVLRAAVPAGRVPPRRAWLTGVRDDPDAACPRCGTPLSRRRLGGRMTVWCPTCQPEHRGS